MSVPSPPATPTTGDATSSAAASRARTSVSPGRERGSAEHDPASGLSTRGSLASYDPDSCSWRTSQRCLFGGWDEFSVTWPRSGMTRNGRLFRRRPLVPRTFGKGCSFLPTPKVVMPNEATSSKINARGRIVRASGHDYGMNLAVYVQRWPTPTRADGTFHAIPNKKRLSSMRLSEQIHWVAPPMIQEEKKSCMGPKVGGSLNPTWVEWLMGFPLGWTDLNASVTP
jgi:hypothetical protein